MKKLITLLVVFLMLFNLSFAAGEEAFGDNLNAFLSGLDAQNSDILLTIDAQGQAAEVRIGEDEAGVHASLGFAGMSLGEAMMTSDAAYVSFMGQGYKVQYATITAYAQKMIQQLIGDLNISPEQITADLQMLFMKAMPYLGQFAQVASTEEVENGTKFVVNGPALAEALGAALDGILGDADVAACLDRYLPLFNLVNVEIHAADIQNAWNANKDQIKQVIEGSEISLTMFTDNTYELEALVKNGEEKAGITSKGKIGENIETMTTIGVVGQEPQATIVFTAIDEEIVYDVKMGDASVYEQIVLEGDQLKSISYVLKQQDETIAEMQYANDRFTITARDITIEGEITVREAKRIEGLVTIKQGESTQIVTVSAELQDNALVCTAVVDEVPVVITLTTAEKTTWNDLSQTEGLVEVTEEFLNGLVSLN